MKLNRTFSLLILLCTSATLLVQCKKDTPVQNNKAPVANAGQDQVLLPTNTSTKLDGTASKDLDGKIVTYAWKKLTGGSTCTILNADKDTTTVKNLIEGEYTFVLTVIDNKGASSSDTVNIIVNKLPIAHAGADQIIALPIINAVKLNPTNVPSTDPDGTIVKYEWTKIEGPNQYKIETPNKDTTAVTGLVEGKYSFRLIVTDNKGATNSDTVIVTVNSLKGIWKGNKTFVEGKDTITVNLILNLTTDSEVKFTYKEEGEPRSEFNTTGRYTLLGKDGKTTISGNFEIPVETKTFRITFDGEFNNNYTELSITSMKSISMDGKTSETPFIPIVLKK